MEPFTIVTSISKQEYSKLILGLTFKNTKIRVFFGFCVVMVIVLILNLLNVIRTYPDASEPPIAAAIFFPIVVFFVPLTTIYSSKKQYDANPRLQGDVTYTFSKEFVSIVGNSFNASYEWQNFMKVEETKDFILLYYSKTNAEIIKKQKFTEEQKVYVKQMAGK